MRTGKIRLLIAFGAAALLTGCGMVGPPMPPSLQLPQAPTNLSAVRKGNRVTLTWTPPSQTTDGQTMRARFVGRTLICRSVGERPAAKCDSVGERAGVVPGLPEKGKRRGPANQPVQYVDELPEALVAASPTAVAQYVVEVRNARGRSAALSNQVAIPLAPAVPAATAVTAEVNADGVWFRWCPAAAPKVAGVSYAVVVYRQQAGEPAAVQVAGEVQASAGRGCPQRQALLDQGFEWEKPYRYWVAGTTTVAGKSPVTFEGDNSAAVEVKPHDVFPPAVPAEVEAVASGVGQPPFIDLVWRANAEPDLDGYNVFRRQPDGKWLKLNSAPIKVPAYRDETAAAGASYTYAVSAVDVRGNESNRSAVATEAVPQP